MDPVICWPNAIKLPLTARTSSAIVRRVVRRLSVKDLDAECPFLEVGDLTVQGFFHDVTQKGRIAAAAAEQLAGDDGLKLLMNRRAVLRRLRSPEIFAAIFSHNSDYNNGSLPAESPSRG